MIVGAVVLSGVLPKTVPFFSRSIHIFGAAKLEFSAIFEVIIILLAAFGSYKTTKNEVREANNFTWGAIQEVADPFHWYFHYYDSCSFDIKGTGCFSWY